MKQIFKLQTLQGTEDVTLDISGIYNIGYAGRNQDVVRAHVDELKELGVAAPNHVPTIYPVGSKGICCEDSVEGYHDETSGEVEYALIVSGGRKYVTVGSDHSDRKLEAFSVPLAKAICPNMTCDTVWPFEEVEDHFDQIEMRSYVTKDGVRSLYQDGTLAEILGPADQTALVEEFLGRKMENEVIFSGTLPTKDGMVYGERFEYEMVDPVLNRKLSGGYDLVRLPDPRD